MAAEKKLLDVISDNKAPHYEPYGWHQWPEHPALSFQFRRALGETQEGGGAVSECFQAASRMVPGDRESWHVEWLKVAERNRLRGDAAERDGHLRTAMNCWLRAANYYRHAEFYMSLDDPRRMGVFDRCEQMSAKYFARLDPPGEAVQVPYENGQSLSAYFVRSPLATGRQPVLICFGGLDSFKDELWFMLGRGAVQRGISVLMVDGPGQGASLRRHGIRTRFDYEVPVGRCIDYLEGRDDIDPKRIAVSGSSLGGYYSARAACFEPRLAACVSHGGNGDIYAHWAERGENYHMAFQIKWISGTDTVAAAREHMREAKLWDVLGNMKCPYLLIHGGFDTGGVERARKVYECAKEAGVDVTFHLVGEEETGADHCQHDNPTLGQEIVGDWLADRFGIDQTDLRG
jgi:pimeloyl-ACP methyl ester carboxylesterase